MIIHTKAQNKTPPTPEEVERRTKFVYDNYIKHPKTSAEGKRSMAAIIEAQELGIKLPE